MDLRKFFLLFTLIPSLSAAQFDRSYTVSPVMDTIPAHIHTQFSQRLEADKSQVAEPDKRINKFRKHLYDERFKYLLSQFNDDYMIADSELTPYLQNVLKRIYAANPQLPKETAIYAYRSSVPNAFSFGEGTLAITLGLLGRLENESQLAFIICHELAHYHRKHAEQQMQALAQLNYDKDLEKKISRMNQSGGGTYVYKKELLKQLGLSITRHSRSYEFESDSVGLRYFLNTDYDRNAPIACMQILENADKGVSQHMIDFRQRFDSPLYPFQSAWLAYEKSTVWHKSEKDGEFGDSDTTHTHPNCKRRMAALQRQLGGAAHMNRRNDDSLFQYFSVKSRFEEIESHYHYKKYGKALFQSLLVLEKYPDNAYLHAMVAKCLYQLYTYQKNHEIGKVLELPDNRFDENYDRFLTFVHKLRLQELAGIGYAYAESKQEQFHKNEEFVYAYWLCSKLPASRTQPEKVKTDYLSAFPSGKYAKTMQ
jgi:Zn-dependent protease with chaperone function